MAREKKVGRREEAAAEKKAAAAPSSKTTELPTPKDNTATGDPAKGMTATRSRTFRRRRRPRTPPRLTQATEQARQLLQQGRKALKDGQLDKAEECGRKADGLKPNLGWWEDDTPAKLLADVQAAKAARSGTGEGRIQNAAGRPARPAARRPQGVRRGQASTRRSAWPQQAKVAPGAKD